MNSERGPFILVHNDFQDVFNINYCEWSLKQENGIHFDIVFIEKDIFYEEGTREVIISSLEHNINTKIMDLDYTVCLIKGIRNEKGFLYVFDICLDKVRHRAEFKERNLIHMILEIDEIKRDDSDCEKYYDHQDNDDCNNGNRNDGVSKNDR